jgi:DMSO/TMAO reductase YedYZ molybdopterin-dependent catalytic subunit
MTIIHPRGSLNRPQGGVDQPPLIEHRNLIARIERRAFLRGTVSLGALTLLTGCDISNESALQSVLRAMSAWNDRVQAFIFNPHKLARTYSDADVMMPPRFNAFYAIDQVKPVDGATWKLELAGLIENKKPWTKDELYALPRETQITQHVCVEGWDYIGK